MADERFIRIAAPEGVDRDNEAVAVTTAATFDGNPYFIDLLFSYSDSAIFNNDGVDGFWTGTGKTGTQLTVVARLPADATEIGFDLGSATPIRTVSGTVYAYYRGYGRVERDSDILGTLGFTIPGLLDRAGAWPHTVYRMKTFTAEHFAGVTLSTVDNVAANLTFTITTDAGESGVDEEVTINSGTNEATSTFGSLLNYAAGETIRITVPANTAGANNVAVLLQRG